MQRRSTTLRQRHPTLRTAVITLVSMILLVGSVSAGAQRRTRDYFTELEISDIQMSQEIVDRTTVLLWIADRRLLELNPPEADPEDEDGDGGFGVTVGNAIIRILNPEGAAQLDEIEQARAELEDNLAGHTRADLLRGYIQALEETMDNIDDAYERNRGDVKEPIEALKDFSENAMDTLLNLETTSDGEASALEDAIEQTQVVISGSAAALETISK